MKLLSPQTGCAFVLRKGERLVVTDVEGRQVSDLFCIELNDPGHVFSAGRSIDYADSILMGEGSVLYSNRSIPMLRIEKDGCGRHDLLLTPCSLKMFQIVSGDAAYHPSCHENLATNLAAFGVSPDGVGTTFNIFMNVVFDSQGRIDIQSPLSQAGTEIVFEALMDLAVGLTACAHEETNAGRCKPIGYAVLSSTRADVPA